MAVNNKNGGEIIDQRSQGFVERMDEVFCHSPRFTDKHYQRIPGHVVSV